MAQRYTQPLPLRRMAEGTCPECGDAPDTHLEDTRPWIPRSCDLTRSGVGDRIAQYEADLASGHTAPPRPLPSGRVREDRGSRTEADAAAFEAAHAYRPSRLEDAMDRGYDPSPEDYR